MEWISVKDRMPENLERVFIYDASSKNTPWMYAISHGIVVRSDKNITHWMPLPEPPKE